VDFSSKIETVTLDSKLTEKKGVEKSRDDAGIKSKKVPLGLEKKRGETS